jgi:NADH-quinone oxidoreductase subunit L
MVTIILFAPLFGAILCGFGYMWLGEKGSMWAATRLVFIAFLK